jgi:UDP:flavonoid glycosyltransferase YjiC (YdhE family)
MRALFTVQPSIGHLHPLIPVANALADVGHEVAICSAASFRREVEAFGLTHIDAGLDWLTEDMSTWDAFPAMPPPGPQFAAFVVTVFADITAGQMVPDLLTIARDWQPDLIVREGMEFAGCIAAERLGVAHASVAGNGYAAVDSPQVRYFPGNRSLVAEALGRHRARFGLPPDPNALMPYRYLHLCFIPPQWDGTAVPRPANSHFLRHTDTLRPSAQLPAWVRQVPDGPTVYASLGTVFNKTPGVLEAIIEGLREEPINLIVTIGSDQNPARFGPQPPNVHLVTSLPQPQLLPRCQLVVTHGGFNTVKESLSAGVPMVVVPITADQPYNAERCAAHGVARVVTTGGRTAEAIREAAHDVLTDPSYRDNTRRVQAQMQALPGPAHVVRLLETAARQPVRAGPSTR